MTIYCVDANSIITMHQSYPRSLFPSVWENVDQLIEAKRLYVHRQVYEEWKFFNTGECVKWKQTLPTEAVVEMDDEQNAFVADLLRSDRYLRNFYALPENARKADPYVIAVAATAVGAF